MNILVVSSASGTVTGAHIKVWNVEMEVCTHHFDYSGQYIRSMFFPAGDKDHECIFVTSAGSLIRTCWDGLPGAIASDIVNMPELDHVWRTSAFSPCVSLFAASSRVVRDETGGVTLYDMKAMSVVQRVTLDSAPRLSSALAFSRYDKTVVCDFGNGEIMVLQAHNLNITRRLRNDSNVNNCASLVAFDPSGSAEWDKYVRLCTLSSCRHVAYHYTV